MTCCRLLLRSSASNACFSSGRFYIALSCRTVARHISIVPFHSVKANSSVYLSRRGRDGAHCFWSLLLHSSSSSQSTDADGAPSCTKRNREEELKFLVEYDNSKSNEDDALSLQEKRSNKFVVVNFYVLVDIDDPQYEVARHKTFIENKDIRGRILISSQGLNAQYSGPFEDAIAYANWIQEDPRFSGLFVQVSPCFNGHAFPRLKLRYKPSLVQIEGGTKSLPITDPSLRAIPLSPQEWKEKLTKDSCHMEDADNGSRIVQKSLLVLDVRNGYEWDIGHFKGVQRPWVDCFKSTEFGLQYTEDKENGPLTNIDKNTEVLMYCTGGIRCDVYSVILRQRGFKNLYSLQGGVARYLIEENGENWIGNLFVFDSRLSVPPLAYKQKSDEPEDGEQLTADLEPPESPEQLEFCSCKLCKGPLSQIRHRSCANLDCNRLFLCCDQCAQQAMGCCSMLCVSAPRKRPFFSNPQQYDRWHNYRDGRMQPRPVGYLGKRAKRTLRARERQLAQNANLTPPEKLDDAST